MPLWLGWQNLFLLRSKGCLYNWNCAAEYYLIDYFTRFSPEQLGITATSAFLWSFMEVVAILFSFYICSVMAEIKALDLIAFCGYKYVG